MKHSSLATLLLSFIGLSLSTGCATNNAEQMRDKNPFTIGFTGLQVRPTANIGIGIGGEILETKGYSCTDSDARCLNKKEPMKYEGDKQLEGESKSRRFSAYLNYFPSKTSAFFIGIGGVKKLSESKILVIDSDESVSYTSEATSIRPGIGWNWIWESGFSLFLDFGYPILISQSQKHKDSVSDEGKNAAKSFEKYLYRQNGMIEGGGGSSMIGWSFHF